MKKLFTIAAALVAAIASAYTVAQYDLAEAGELPARTTGGKVVAVQVYAPTNGTVALTSVWSAEVYTNLTTVSASTNYLWTVAYSNTNTRAVYTNTYTSAGWPMPIYSIPLATNDLTSVSSVTNVTRVFKEQVSTNVAIVSGSAANHVYSGSPASNTYIAPGERMVYTGALGGWLRLILE